MPKVMLVEDDNNLREIYAARMQAEGYEVVTAADGEEALVTGKAEKPDLIISDVMMPKISGFEMLDIIRNTEGMKDVKIIMLTALGQSDEQERADKLGANKYLVKSQVTLEDIVKAAHEMLGDQGDAAPAPAGTTDAPAPAEATPAPAVPAAAPTPTPVVPPVETPAPVEPAPAATEEPSSTPATVPTPETPTDTAPAPAEPATTDEAVAKTNDSSIESIVAGATEAANGNAGGAPEATATAPAAPENDSQVLTDAVDNLLAKTPESDQAGSSSDAPAATSSGMKVIEPIETKPEKDINELLAAEEAQEAKTPEAAPETPAETPAPAEAATLAVEAPAEAETPAPAQPAPETPETPSSTPDPETPTEATPTPREATTDGTPQTPAPAEAATPAAEAPAEPAKAPEKPFDPNIAL